MLVSKNDSSGFTLIEVLLSVAIVGLVLTPILMVQSMTIRNTGKRARIVDRTFAAKKFLIDSEVALAPDADESSSEKKIANPAMTLRFDLTKPAEGSSIKKFKFIKRATVTSAWVDQTGRHQDRLVTFLFRPEGKAP